MKLASIWILSLSILSGPAFPLPPHPAPSPAAPVSPKERAALAKKDPCYRWYVDFLSGTVRTQRNLMVAAGQGQPCKPVIEGFQTSLPMIPPQCAGRKLGKAPKLFLRELKDAAAGWNQRGWEHWEVEPKNPITRELEKARDFFVRILHTDCHG